MQEFREQFLAPTPDYAMCYCWMWNSAVTHEETRRQINEMEKAGIRSFMILPIPRDFRPHSFKTELDPEYLTEEYFREYRYAVDCAAEKGMRVSLYDEGGWPSGSACCQVTRKLPDAEGRYIDFRSEIRQSGERFTRPVCEACEEYLAAFDKKTNRRISEGEIFKQQTEITVYVTKPCEENPYIRKGYMTDLADPRVAKEFLKVTHDGYAEYLGEYFGSVIQLAFDDEAALMHFAWTPGMAAQFREQFGYELLDYLPWIREVAPCRTEAEHRALRDYRHYLGELVQNNFLIPVRDWCRNHNLVSSGHLSGDHDTAYFTGDASYGNPMVALRCFDTPGVDVIWRQYWFEKEKAKDAGSAFFPRLASSAAAQIGSSRSITEMYAVYGDGMNFDHMRGIMNLFAVRGINLFVAMLISYGKDGAKCLMECPSFDPAKPGFYNMTRFNKTADRISYVANLCALSGRGKPVGKESAKAALYLPLEDIWYGGETKEKALVAYEALGEALEGQHVDFDIIDDDFIRSCEIRDGVLCGEYVAYSSVALGDYSHIPADVYEKLKPLAEVRPEPVVQCAYHGLLAKKADLGEETVYFLVNGGNEVFTGEIAIPNTGKCYIMDASDGSIQPARGYVEGEQTHIAASLIPGRELLLLFSGETETQPCADAQRENKPQKEQLLTNFEATIVRDCYITKEGIKNDYPPAAWKPVALGRWAELSGHAFARREFSGEVAYRCHVRLGEDTRSCGKILLDCGKVENTARVYADGEFCGICGFFGDRVELPVCGKREFDLEIVVANSFANQSACVDFDAFWEKNEQGIYRDAYQLEFDRDLSGGGLLGPVRLLLTEA